MLVAVIKFSPFGFIASAASGVTLNIVAHEDDDLLFLSPDLLHAIQSGRTVRTIFMTSGDAGRDSTYWLGRQAGIRAAYAQMSGVADSWTQADAGVSGHPISVYTLSAYPAVSVAFLHLPDGNIDGSGFASTNHESLENLWGGSLSTIHAIDGSSSYTKQTLTNTLAALITSFQPDQVNIQDYVGNYGDGDHSDHHSAAFFAKSAVQQYKGAYVLTGYQDYNTSSLPANVAGADLSAKQNAFYAYGQDDSGVCDSTSSCAGSNYAIWLQRQYMVGSGSGGGNQPPVADAGTNLTVVPGATVQLDGSGSSDPNGDALTYQWSQIAGPTVTLSSTSAAQPTFTAPASPTTLTFQLIVNDGQQNSTPASVIITVSNSSDLALFATVTASSETPSTGQTANKAIDGVIDGWPGDYTKEWATNGGRAGSWLKLTWTSPQTVSM
ncbi:MAG TPA: PIG-L family deacetylase, partial [Ktedonobacterales bacterium]